MARCDTWAANCPSSASPASVSHFMSHMAHELRGSLNAIAGFADLLHAEVYGELNSEQQQAVGDIMMSARRLRDMADSVVEIGRLEAGTMVFDFTIVSVREAVELSLSVVAEELRDHLLRTTVDVPPDLAVWADEGRLRQALLRLLHNALKYSEENTTITVRGSADGDTVRLAVTDQGCGIAPENHARIFQEFVSLDVSEHTRPGSGLGLALVERLMRAMDGQVEVESALGQGATFTLVLPRRDAPLT